MEDFNPGEIHGLAREGKQTAETYCGETLKQGFHGPGWVFGIGYAVHVGDDPTCAGCAEHLAARRLPKMQRAISEKLAEEFGGYDPMRAWDTMREKIVEHGLPAEAMPPRPTKSETRPDPLLPVVRTVKEAPEREAARLAFGGLVEAGEDPGVQLTMFPSTPGPVVPLLDMADMRGGPIMARGRGAPLDLRLLVGACLSTPHGIREARARLAVTVRELRDFCFPNGWKRARDWPAIRAALWRAHTYMIPGAFEWGGVQVHGWVPFRLVGGAGEGAALDDVVLIDIELPPGSANGPMIRRGQLARLGVESAPRFRAYIAAHSVAWVGPTRMPHPKNRRHFVWTGVAGRYHVLTDADRRRLAFGKDDRRNRTRADQDAAWRELPGVEILNESASSDRGPGWIVVPSAAAEAIRQRANRRTRGG